MHMHMKTTRACIQKKQRSCIQKKKKKLHVYECACVLRMHDVMFVHVYEKQ